MDTLIIPESIRIELRNPTQQDFPTDNILLYVKTKARHKNDFQLGPFVSDNKGIVTIEKTDLENEVIATYESGLMDYSNIEDNSSFVELRIYKQTELDKLIESRTEAWTTLLKGEKNRWVSIEELIDTLKNSNNKKLQLNDSNRSITVNLNGTQKRYEFKIEVYKK